MWSIVARELNFGMTVVFVISISAKQRAMETVVSAHIYILLGYLLEHTLLVAFCNTVPC